MSSAVWSSADRGRRVAWETRRWVKSFAIEAFFWWVLALCVPIFRFANLIMFSWPFILLKNGIEVSKLKVDHGYLASFYHMGIIAGFTLISEHLESAASAGNTVSFSTCFDTVWLKRKYKTNILHFIFTVRFLCLVFSSENKRIMSTRLMQSLSASGRVYYRCSYVPPCLFWTST